MCIWVDVQKSALATRFLSEDRRLRVRDCNKLNYPFPNRAEDWVESLVWRDKNKQKVKYVVPLNIN